MLFIVFLWDFETFYIFTKGNLYLLSPIALRSLQLLTSGSRPSILSPLPPLDQPRQHYVQCPLNTDPAAVTDNTFFFPPKVHSILAWKFALRRLQNGECLVRLRFAIGVTALRCDVCLHGLDRLGQLLAAFLVNIVQLH